MTSTSPTPFNSSTLLKATTLPFPLLPSPNQKNPTTYLPTDLLYTLYMLSPLPNSLPSCKSMTTIKNKQFKPKKKKQDETPFFTFLGAPRKYKQNKTEQNDINRKSLSPSERRGIFTRLDSNPSKIRRASHQFSFRHDEKQQNLPKIMNVAGRKLDAATVPHNYVAFFSSSTPNPKKFS